MSFVYRVYYKWPDDSRINDGSKGVASEIETSNPVSIGDFVESPFGNSYSRVNMIVHEREYSWLFVSAATEDEKSALRDVPKY